MTTGDAIFLSSLFLGLIALYIVTRDRWNWKKLILWLLGVPVGLVVVLWTSIYVNERMNKECDVSQNTQSCLMTLTGLPQKEAPQKEAPQKETQFWGIQLGATVADVRFAKGVPTDTDKTGEKDAPGFFYQVDKKGDKYSAGYVVYFKKGKVREILFYLSPERDTTDIEALISVHHQSYAVPTIQGINLNSTLDQVINKFGQPSYISRSKDELSRIYSFEKYNVVFEFKKGQLAHFGIYDSSTGPVRFSDEAAPEASP